MTRKRSSGLDAQAGVVAVELAMTIPALAVVAWLVALAGVAAVDQIVVQHAATVAVRTAAATVGPGEAVRAGQQAAGPRQVDVSIQPQRYRPGQLVTVVVRHDRRVGPVAWTSEARAVARVEAGAGP